MKANMKKILIAIIVGALLLGSGFGIHQYNAAQAKKQALIAEEQAKQKKEAEEKKAKEERFKNLKKEYDTADFDIENSLYLDVAEAVEAATQEAMDSARAADYSALDSFGVMISKKEMTEDEESAFHELTKAVTDRYDASKKTVDDLYAEVSAIDPAEYGSYYTDAYKTDVTSNMDTYTDAYNKGKYQNAYDALTTVKALYAAAEGDQNRAKERSETYAAKAETQPASNKTSQETQTQEVAPGAGASTSQQAPAASAPAPAHDAGWYAATAIAGTTDIGDPLLGEYMVQDAAGNTYAFDTNGNQTYYRSASDPVPNVVSVN